MVNHNPRHPGGLHDPQFMQTALASKCSPATPWARVWNHLRCSQLALADKPAGLAVCALAWPGLEKADLMLDALKRKLPPTVSAELVTAVPQFSTFRQKRRQGDT